MPLKNSNSGFTLIEIAISIVIIGLLVAGVIKASGLSDGAKVSNAITLAQDISTAVNMFKQQQHMLPGDMLISDTAPEIPNVIEECMKNGSYAGDNNGRIDAGIGSTIDESRCIPEILFRAGLAKVEKDGNWPVFKSYYGVVRVKAASQTTVTGFSPSISNVVEFEQLPCDIAQQIDRKIDNDDLASGKAIAFGGACTAGSIVSYFAVAL